MDCQKVQQSVYKNKTKARWPRRKGKQKASLKNMFPSSHARAIPTMYMPFHVEPHTPPEKKRKKK
jgi:hypothetical protein